MAYVLDFSEISNRMISEVGGKNASLGEMTQHLKTLGIKVPPGFATTAEAYREFLRENKFDQKILDAVATLDPNNIKAVKKTSELIQQLILDGNLPAKLVDEVKKHYAKLIGDSPHGVAVRSSATTEDLDDASFAGQQDTYLNVHGIDNVLTSIKKVFASLFNQRAITYRIQQGSQHHDLAISVGIQKMVRSDQAASGVLFTLDTESGFNQVILITAGYGLGEALVQGNINPDEFCVYKPMLQAGKPAIISRKLGSKALKMIYANDGNKTLQTVSVPIADQQRFCLDDDEILLLAQQALLIEQHYKKPMDIEWAKDGIDNEIYIVQARPETVQVKHNAQIIEEFFLQTKSKIITQGRSIGQHIGQGKARLITNPNEMHLIGDGDVLVTDMTDPDWEPIMKRASAIVTNRGGRTCHAAIVARELGIPAVVGCGNATETIKPAELITVSCAEGETGYIYEGLLKYEVKTTSIAEMPAIPVEIMMNLANPEQAFNNQFIPNAGVGLTRLEFIINTMVGIHPNACLEFEMLSADLQQQIKSKSQAYGSPVEFYIEKLCEGIATIAAAFFPKPIIVRFSDFKSNEYANLIGGQLYETPEDNPMLGYRGASRYLSGNFRRCFELECEAIKRVRNKLGLTNTQVMFPFVRTVPEAQQLIELISAQGLKRGSNELKFYMMCEIPSNVLLAEDFLQYFDGYSIGSNDLTQLTLGLDRDSAAIAHLFDERNPAMKILLHQVIKTCKKMGKYVGICGQGPSDHLDLAEWLVEEGISSISLNPDTIVQTWMSLAEHLKHKSASK